MTSIIVVGSGNVANSFCRLIQKSNSLLLKGIVARNELVGSALAGTYGTSFHNIKAPNLPEADVVIIAVSDSAISEVASSNFSGNFILVHTAGAVAKSELAAYSNHFGVIYPLQSFKKIDKEVIDFPILFDGSDDDTTLKLSLIAKQLSAKVIQVNDADRLKYHLSAVFVNNFSNYLFTLAYDYCEKNSLDFSVLLPLIKMTAAKITSASPVSLQTGPAKRNDLATIDKHLKMMEGEEEMKEVYELFTGLIKGKNQ